MSMLNLIAFKGKVELDKAVWDNIWGMYVTFDLEQRAHETATANPFKKFTRMKKGKVGTRFHAAMVMAVDDSVIVYDDEVMLKGWSDGTTGWKVTFWLSDEGQHPFLEYAKGTVFEMAAVELDDDQTPIDQVKRDRVITAKKHRKQTLSNFAALLCRTSEFYDYLAAHYDWPRGGGTYEHQAADFIRSHCAIQSRSELDTDPAAANRFHNEIREPYAEWNSRRQ